MQPQEDLVRDLYNTLFPRLGGQDVLVDWGIDLHNTQSKFGCSVFGEKRNIFRSDCLVTGRLTDVNDIGRTWRQQ